MTITTLLDHIDSGHMALPEFQRGYVWNRDQVRALMDSLYRRHPVGSLLVWVTSSDTADFRGDGQLAQGVVKLLLDGQQRITSLYGIIRGRAPKFFDGNESAFTGLHFNLDSEEFAFYSPIKMKEDPLWVDVTKLMKSGNDGIGAYINELNSRPDLVSKLGIYVGRLNRILGIASVQLHAEEVTGDDKTIDVVVDIFNRVNSGGTKLSKGDLALAKICAEWPDARDQMKLALQKWQDAGFNFSLDWLLRNVNTTVTGEAKFSHLHDIHPTAVQDGLKRAEKNIDYALNLVAGRLGLDHDRVLFGAYAFPVMTRLLDQRGGHLASARERDRLLFWYLQSAMWGRFSGSTESVIDRDLEILAQNDNDIDSLIDELHLWHGSLQVSPGNFTGWSLGARFYPILYMLTRVGEAVDWGTGLPLKASMLGNMSALEVHHIFPKAQLYKKDYRRPEVNAVANFCFLTKDTNLQISDTPPEVYFDKVAAAHPGALESQWIPMDPHLWRMENYLHFLEARRRLLADATNKILVELLHGDSPYVDELTKSGQKEGFDAAIVPGGIDSAEEETELLQLRQWISSQGLPEGQMSFELADPESGAPLALLDLAWPQGLQEGLSSPVAVLLNEPPETLAAASAQGFVFFTTISEFKTHVLESVLGMMHEVA